MTTAEIERTFANFSDVKVDKTFREKLIAWSHKNQIFAILNPTANPLKLSLRCDPNLAKLLREKYESVLPGQHLNSRQWITILLTGQLSDDEVRDLIRHGYEIVT